MEFTPEIGGAIVLAAIAHTGKIVYELIRQIKNPPERAHKFTQEEIGAMALVIASAVGKVVSEQLSAHSDREERQTERLLSIETHEADRTSRIEAILTRLTTVAELSAAHAAESYRTLMDRLEAVSRSIQR